MSVLASVDSKQLIRNLTPLDATLTKNAGVGESRSIFGSTVHSILPSIFRTLFEVPYTASPLFATLAKTPCQACRGLRPLGQARDTSSADRTRHGRRHAPKAESGPIRFSDILRLSPTEVLKHLSLEEGKIESAQNNEKAIELLKKSPYASNLGNAGLFLKQLHSQAKELKQLISPQLGNKIYFASQLLLTAPALAPGNKSHMAALPLGSRLKIDPWSAGVSLMKSKPMTLLSGRDKMPFAVTPLVPYLTRYVEVTAAPADSKTVVALNQ
jgi:hypothetical protein